MIKYEDIRNSKIYDVKNENNGHVTVNYVLNIKENTINTLFDKFKLQIVDKNLVDYKTFIRNSWEFNKIAFLGDDKFECEIIQHNVLSFDRHFNTSYLKILLTSQDIKEILDLRNNKISYIELIIKGYDKCKHLFI